MKSAHITQYFYCVFITFVAALLIGATPLFRKNKSIALRTFCLFFLCVAFWSGFLSLHIISSENRYWSTLTAKLMHYFVIWIPVFYLHSIDSLFEFGRKNIIRSGYVLGLIFTLANAFDLLIDDSKSTMGFKYFLTLKPAYNIFLAYFLSYLVFSYYLLISAFKRFEGHKKNQVKIIITSTFIGHIGAMTNYFAAYGYWIYPITPYFTVLVVPYVGGILYAILAFRLFDFDLLARWGLAYILLASLLALLVLVNSEILALIGSSFGLSKGLAYLFVSCITVYLFDPLKKRITKFVDLFIFHSPDFQLLLAGLEEELQKNHTVESLAVALTSHIEKIWNIHHAGFVLWNTNSGVFDLYPKNAFTDQLIVSRKGSITASDFLIKTLETERRLFKYGIIFDDELVAVMNNSSSGEKMTFSKIRRTMRWLGASACVPLMGDQLIGFIVLGPKKSNSVFNHEDRKFLSHISELVSQKIGNLVSGIPIQQYGLVKI